VPTYEYACTACGERTEAKQSFHDAPLEECPVCGGKLRKLYSPVGIVFKGSGFYSTDARKAAASPKKDEGRPKEEKRKKKEEPSAPKKEKSA
jgi:putative FmdB family regulatory protein